MDRGTARVPTIARVRWLQIVRLPTQTIEQDCEAHETMEDKRIERDIEKLPQNGGFSGKNHALGNSGFFDYCRGFP
jgi:hypothetical protein